MDRETYEKDRSEIERQINGLKAKQIELDHQWWDQPGLAELVGTYWLQSKSSDFESYAQITGYDRNSRFLRGWEFEIAYDTKGDLYDFIVTGVHHFYRNLYPGKRIEAEEFWLAYHRATRYAITDEGKLVYEAEAMKELDNSVYEEEE